MKIVSFNLGLPQMYQPVHHKGIRDYKQFRGASFRKYDQV